MVIHRAFNQSIVAELLIQFEFRVGQRCRDACTCIEAAERSGAINAARVTQALIEGEFHV